MFLSSSLGWTQSRIKTSQKAMTVAAYKVSSYSATSSLTQITSGDFLRRTRYQEEEKLVSAQINFSQSQSMIDRQDGTLQADRTVVAVVSTKVSSNWAVIAITSLSDNLRDPESVDDGFSDLLLRLSQSNQTLADWLNGSASYTVVIPTSERSTRIQDSQGSLQAGYTFSFTDRLLAKGLGFSVNFNGGRNFHKYEEDINGNILNVYTLRETLSGSYSYKNFAASASLILRHGINYQGGATQSFEHSQELTYNFSKTWSGSLGHTNSGAWYRPNGQDSNLRLINEDDSIIYVSTTAVF